MRLIAFSLRYPPDFDLHSFHRRGGQPQRQHHFPFRFQTLVLTPGSPGASRHDNHRRRGQPAPRTRRTARRSRQHTPGETFRRILARESPPQFVF
jgi:hypothetical protein